MRFVYEFLANPPLPVAWNEDLEFRAKHGEVIVLENLSYMMDHHIDPDMKRAYAIAFEAVIKDFRKRVNGII
jgi:hypothetical protein